MRSTSLPPGSPGLPCQACSSPAGLRGLSRRAEAPIRAQTQRTPPRLGPEQPGRRPRHFAARRGSPGGPRRAALGLLGRGSPRFPPVPWPPFGRGAGGERGSRGRRGAARLRGSPPPPDASPAPAAVCCPTAAPRPRSPWKPPSFTGSAAAAPCPGSSAGPGSPPRRRPGPHGPVGRPAPPRAPALRSASPGQACGAGTGRSLVL